MDDKSVNQRNLKRKCVDPNNQHPGHKWDKSLRHPTNDIMTYLPAYGFTQDHRFCKQCRKKLDIEADEQKMNAQSQGPMFCKATIIRRSNYFIPFWRHDSHYIIGSFNFSGKSVNEESADHTERTKNLGNGLAEQKNDSALPSKRWKKPSKNDTREKGNVFSLKSPNKKKELKDVAAKKEILSVKSENKESTKLISKTHHLVGISEHIEKEYIPEKKYRGAAKSSKKKDVPVSPPLKYESLGAGPTPLVATGKKHIGCHVSAAGGIWTCFENGEKSNASAIAMFLRNQRSWNAKPLDEDSIEKWNEAMKDFPRHLILPHGSYLMNLGSPKQETLEKSRQLLIEELQRCEKLGIPHFNFHPGSTLGEMSREECCKLVAESINLAHKQTSKVICVIENMSKQGFTVGGDLHEIRLIIEAVEDKSRVGVCIDTCHAHAAGYDLASEKGFNEMVGDFEKIIGWQFLRALHINDSKGKVGDHKDRHENIGKGFIGREGFRRIMNCPRFNDVPLILETPFVREDVYGKEIKLLQKLIE